MPPRPASAHRDGTFLSSGVGHFYLALTALYAAYTHYVVAQVIAKNLHRDNPVMAEQETVQARGWIAAQLDRGRQFDVAKAKRREDGAAHAVIEPIHEEMFSGRVRGLGADRER